MDIDVHVASINEPLGDDVRILARVEYATARGIHRGRDRRAHTAGRSVVRRRLSIEYGLPAADVPLRVDPRRRPPSPIPPCFSIAHAGELVVVAVARCAVGVDVEPLAAVEDDDVLIDLYASWSERMALRSLPRPERDAAFLKAWVRKEVVLKAIGVGITGDLTRLDSRLGFESDARRWQVETLPELPPGYVAAVAVESATESALNIVVHPALFAALDEVGS